MMCLSTLNRGLRTPQSGPNHLVASLLHLFPLAERSSMLWSWAGLRLPVLWACHVARVDYACICICGASMCEFVCVCVRWGGGVG